MAAAPDTDAMPAAVLRLTQGFVDAQHGGNVARASPHGFLTAAGNSEEAHVNIASSGMV